jgi:hypothetical protein
VNNAAVLTAKRELTADGFEMIFGVNHIGKSAYVHTYICMHTPRRSVLVILWKPETGGTIDGATGKWGYITSSP